MPTARSLRVSRGRVHAATAHGASTRIAAAVSTWPGSLMMDVSTNCPSRTVEPNVGPETWRSYRARIDAARLEDPRWDGLLVDRADGDESWLIDDGRARSIDPVRTNRVPDDYSAFDDAYNRGLQEYLAALRAKVGDERLIHTNWGYPYYGLLNGNNLEGFPQANGDSYGAGWTQTVFGARPGVGSYFDWLEKARQPNLTMVQTYEDDGVPDPSGNGSYRNPADQPGFVPNYRKMRFGLTTALLGDGFFSYEINTNGHGSLGLLWFDEYDNARRGRGYLGQPTGDARRVVPELGTANLVRNGGLRSSADLALWDLWVDGRTPAQAEVDLRRDQASRLGFSAHRHHRRGA